jgi:hypothetical protein
MTGGMRTPIHNSRLATLAILAVSLGGTVFAAGTPAGAEARGTVAVAPAALLKSGPAGSGACRSLAARRARSAASEAGTPAAAARRARRAYTRARRRCMSRLRHAAKRKGTQSSVSPAPVASSLVIGIDSGYSGWSDNEIAERRDLGAAITRHEWDPSEAVDGQDDVVQTAAETIHTRLYALLGGNQLGDPNHYREWVVAFVRRYGTGGSFWAEHPDLDASRYAITSIELGNEPYFGEMSPQLYADTVRPTLEEIQRLHLPVSVVLPSRVYGNDTSWMDTLYDRIPDLNSLFAAFADHPYWYGHDPATVSPAGPFGRIDNLRRRMNELGAGAKPIYITEYGESTANCGSECVDETSQAQHLQEMIDATVAHPDWGVKMLSVFQLRDRGTGSGDRELQFGLLRQDGSPKPSYEIVHTAMQQYRGGQ